MTRYAFRGLLFFLLALPWTVKAEEDSASAASIPPNLVAQRVQQMWDVSWERFYVPETHIFYDFLTSYEPGKYLQHLPTVEEVSRIFPNECGYGTGMEDGMIFAGTWLAALVSRSQCETNSETLEVLKQEAHNVFLGVKLCAAVHSDPGFLARAVLPADGKSVYPNTSRDQYTHAVHGCWRFYHSSLCGEADKESVRMVLSLIADRMIRNVIPENDYDSLRLDGSRDTRTISRMWNVMAHEAARLPMIYAAAWDICRESESEELRAKSKIYFNEYRKYVGPAVKQTLTLADDTETLCRWVPTYALLQMQASIELLSRLETDPELAAEMEKALEMGASLARERMEKAERESEGLDMTFLFEDWRIEGGGIPWATPVRKIWYNPRESGEAAVTQLMCKTEPFDAHQQELLNRAILRITPERVATSGIFYLISAYWELQTRK